jgi:hypothetical protein
LDVPDVGAKNIRWGDAGLDQKVAQSGDSGTRRVRVEAGKRSTARRDVSPVLANVYLHYVLDLWFEHKVRKVNRGTSRLFRYADDFVACFDYRHEAAEFEKALAEPLRKFGLELATDKTKTLRFGRCAGLSSDGKTG